MAELRVRREAGGVYDEVSRSHPLPVSIENDLAGRPPAVLAQRGAHARTYRARINVAAGGAGYAAEFIPSGVARIRAVLLSKPSAAITIRLIKAITRSTVGTSTNATIVPLDTADGPSGSVIKLFTAAPTAGTSMGDVFAQAFATTDITYETFGDADTDRGPLVIRGGNVGPNLSAMTEALGVNVSAAATVEGYIEWTED